MHLRIIITFMDLTDFIKMVMLVVKECDVQKDKEKGPAKITCN